MRPTRTPGRTPWAPAAWTLAALCLVATPALADPPGKGMHPGMGMQHGGMGMGKDHGMGYGHGMRPHNAAIHFLAMSDRLGLDDAQVAELRKLRDDWIESNATNEARLKAAQADLSELLAADSIDMKAADAQLAVVGKVEGQLWHAYVAQLKDIKDLLTDDQRARLRSWHSGMGHGPGMGMGMGPGMGMQPGMGMGPGMGSGYDE